MILNILLSVLTISSALTPKDWEGLWKWELSPTKNGELAISKCSKDGCVYSVSALYGDDGGLPSTCVDEGRFSFIKATSAVKKLDGLGKDGKTKCELRFSLNTKTQAISVKVHPDTICICDEGGQMGGPFVNAKKKSMPVTPKKRK